MIKQLLKIGNSQGIIIDKAILDLLKISKDASFEISTKDGGLVLMPIDFKKVHKKVSNRHRKSLDKLGK